MRPLLLLALVAGLCQSAAADLRFPAPTADEAAIRATYERLPARGKGLTVSVYELPSCYWPLVDDLAQPEVVGLYAQDSRRLYLRGGEPDLLPNFVHEWGHACYFGALTRSERRQWERFYRAHLHSMPTPYARSGGAAEGFAESYSLVYLPDPEYPVAASVVAQVRKLIER